MVAGPAQGFALEFFPERTPSPYMLGLIHIFKLACYQSFNQSPESGVGGRMTGRRSVVMLCSLRAEWRAFAMGRKCVGCA
jgi:hypothetical protein